MELFPSLQRKLYKNISTSEDGTNSSHTHNLVKSQSYQGLKFVLSDTKFVNLCSFIIDFKKINVCAYDYCMLVNEYSLVLMFSCQMPVILRNSAKCRDKHCFLDILVTLIF